MKTFFFVAFIACSFYGFAQQTISTLSPNDCRFGQTISVRFNTNFSPKETLDNPSNYKIIYFQVELSNANGDFGSTPTIITQNAMVRVVSSIGATETMAPILGTACNERILTSPGTYSVEAKIPNNIRMGGCYKINVNYGLKKT